MDVTTRRAPGPIISPPVKCEDYQLRSDQTSYRSCVILNESKMTPQLVFLYGDENVHSAETGRVSGPTRGDLWAPQAHDPARSGWSRE